jgi:peroxiredoxin Q/BCP
MKMRKRLWRGLTLGIVTAGAVLAGTIAVNTHVFAGADTLLPPGTVAPDFSLPSQTDTPVSLKDYRGKYVVLYFYPKDQTTGCTIEAHNFERDTAKYAALNAVVLGVSLDTVESHKTFCSKDGLNFKLLADPDHKVIDAYGVPVVSMGPIKIAKRDTFLIGPDGKILKTWQVSDVQKHSDEVLAAIEEAKK